MKDKNGNGSDQSRRKKEIGRASSAPVANKLPQGKLKEKRNGLAKTGGTEM